MLKVKDSQSQSGDKIVGKREIRPVLISKPDPSTKIPADQREAIWE